MAAEKISITLTKEMVEDAFKMVEENDKNKSKNFFMVTPVLPANWIEVTLTLPKDEWCDGIRKLYPTLLDRDYIQDSAESLHCKYCVHGITRKLQGYCGATMEKDYGKKE